MEDLCNVSKETAYELGYIKGLSDAVVHGRWEKNNYIWDEIPTSYCSCCGQSIADECILWFKFCSNCGAKMDLE